MHHGPGAASVHFQCIYLFLPWDHAGAGGYLVHSDGNERHGELQSVSDSASCAAVMAARSCFSDLAMVCIRCGKRENQFAYSRDFPDAGDGVSVGIV